MKKQVITPIDNSIYYEFSFHDKKYIENALTQAKKTQQTWQDISIEKRIKYVQLMVDKLVEQKIEIGIELAWQMGRPANVAQNELLGVQERTNYLCKVAIKELSEYTPTKENGFEKKIIQEPLGVICVLSPWNYPFLTSINAIVPALIAGNSVILKHSAQTPLVAERYLEAAKSVGMPKNVFQIVHCSHEQTSVMIADNRVDGVVFTGSVDGGLAVQKSISNKFIPCTLELGGKDPAYVRHDANISNAINNLVDGSFFNSGQSCCSIERIYVHKNIYKDFVDGFVSLTKQYKLGNPLEDNNNLGPMVSINATNYVRAQIKSAVTSGAKALIDEKLFKHSKEGSAYLAPQVLIDTNHSMDIMRKESFGPVVGIMSVDSDSEAIKLMNDSDLGLTASIWTNDIDIARNMAPKIQTGTFFMNRCDYLDPSLAWGGVKNTGRGISLSVLGFRSFVRQKSYNFKF